MGAHAGLAVGTPGEGGEAVLHQCQHLRIQFHRVHRARLVIKRLQHVLPAAGPQHQYARPLQQVVGQRGGEEIEIGQGFPAAVEAGDRAGAVAIAEYRQLRRRFLAGRQAEARRLAQRDAAIFHHGEHAQRTAHFRQHACPDAPSAAWLRSL